MTRHKRRTGADPRHSGELEIVVALQFIFDLQQWVQTDPRTTLRVLRLVVEICRDPHKGIGKPEPLKHDLGGYWSRRITDEHRLVYRHRESSIIEFARARTHYG